MPWNPWILAVSVLLLLSAAACSSVEAATSTRSSNPLAGASIGSTDHRGAAAPLTWPPPEPWVIPPSPAQPPDPAFDFPTPSPAPAPDGAHHPSSSPYTALSRGYDASFPQCASGSKPAGASFGIVGINNGRAFTLNACFPMLLKAAPNAGIYLNTGFNPANAPRLLPYCATRAASILGATATQQLAYGLGCSTTIDTLRVMSDFHLSYPSIWWLDVEEANSWDDADPVVNQFSLRGQIDALANTGRKVAVYSTFPDWKQITGGWGDPLIAGDWVAGKPPQEACSSPGFSGAPVWLAQELATWPGSGYDSDYAC